MPVTMLRKLLRRKKAGQQAAINPWLSLLQQSELFDASWYLQRYPDIARDAHWSKQPALHYLELGYQEQRQPGPLFDAIVYCKRYPDIGQQNPLVHYLLHGRLEGRQCQALPTGLNIADLNRQVATSYPWLDRIVQHLWGGHAATAIAELQQAFDRDDLAVDARYFCGWHLARWWYFDEDYQQVLRIGHELQQLGGEYAKSKSLALLFGYTYQQLGDTVHASTALQQYLDIQPNDSDVQFALANCFSAPAEKLALINQVYQAAGLQTLQLDPSAMALDFHHLSVSNRQPRLAESAEQGEPLVSVIIPAYNAGERLDIAVHSLLQQRWYPLEVLVVDDCSTDDTYERACRLAAEDPRVRAFRQPANAGAYAARNRGLQEARGDFLTTHDSDDWSHPDKIACQVAFMQQNPEVMGVCTHWIRATEQLHFTQNWRLNDWLIHWSHSSFLFRRAVYEELGGWDQVVIGGDNEFIWRVQSYYGKHAFAKLMPDVPMAFALDDEGSLTRTKATHVRTMYAGLRHIYRESCRWWHKNSDCRINGTEQARVFPVPKTMVERNPECSEADFLCISDFSSNVLNQAFYPALTELATRQRLALLHWPYYKKPVRKLNDAFFELAMAGCEPVVFGQQVVASTVVLAGAELLDYVPDMLPGFEGVRRVIVLGGEPLTTEAIEHCQSVFGCEPVSKTVEQLQLNDKGKS